MGVQKMGEIICKLRKERGMTQEELGKCVGVTTQAVSKWECGGVPDIELVPVIADCFGISTDELFGRNVTDYCDLEIAIAKKIVDLPNKERMKVVFDMCWKLLCAIGGDMFPIKPENGLDEITKDMDCPHYSQQIWNEGIGLMCLYPQRYFALIPDMENMPQYLFEDVDLGKFFEDMGDKDMYNALLLLYKRDNKSFTDKLLCKNLGISEQKAAEIIDTLKSWNSIMVNEVELDDEVQRIYTFRANPAFVPLMLYAREMAQHPTTYSWFNQNRSKPYLK